MPLNLYLVRRAVDDPVGYDEYSEFVVAASTHFIRVFSSTYALLAAATVIAPVTPV